MKKHFNPKEWLKVPLINKTITNNELVPNNIDNEIEPYIKAIEKAGIDITNNYTNWRNIGFAIADKYGELGREYYHRISKFYENYSQNECNEQYTKCINAKGHGITIATFYHHINQHNIKSVKQQQENNSKTATQTTKAITKQILPTIPERVYQTIPEYLKQVVQPASSSEEKDILLLGALTAFSACLPKLFGIYDQSKVYSNLYLFVTAPASAGKGKLNKVKNLVEPIHKSKREQAKVLKQQYESELATYNIHKKKNDSSEKPSKPPEQMLFIPANNSVTGVYQLISDNNGRGLMFETEGDTLAQAFKSDYGNYSDGFRKAFHHETISYYRRTDREYVDIEKPCLSTILSGTPKQVATLIPNAENGLFSRFIFYYMNIKPTWKNVFKKNNHLNLDDYYTDLGNQFFELYKTLINNQKIEVQLSNTQQQQFNMFFESLQKRYLNLQPEEYIATVRRLGLIAFRFTMIFTAFRIMEDGDVNPIRICEDEDFNNTIAIIKILVKHSSKVFNDLPIETKTQKRMNRKERFLEGLKQKFTRQDYLEIANKLNIPSKTAEGYITSFVKSGMIHRDVQNQYTNTTKES